MEQRIRRAREEIRMRREKGEKFDTPSHKAFWWTHLRLCSILTRSLWKRIGLGKAL
jgi:hypothetical protein